VGALTGRVRRWVSPSPWWRRDRGGLVLYVQGYGATQTYLTRSLDKAREMVIEYVELKAEVQVSKAVEFTWLDNGGFDRLDQ